MTSMQKAIWGAATFMLTAMIVLPPIVHSDTVGFLNMFNAGETAQASEVNDNFDTVEAAINDNDARILVLENDLGTAAAQSVYTATSSQTSDGACNPMVVEVWCDAGDVLLGGGCGGTADQWYFRINSRRPGDEGWTCRPVRNPANSCVATTVTVSAICSDITP